MKRTARARPLLALLLTVGLGAGCTTTSTGDPKPTDTGGAATGGSTTTEESPERPRDIPLDGIDPCTLIPQADYPKFYMTKSGTPKENETFKSPLCRWVGTEVGGFDLTLVTTEGIEKWLDGSRSGEVERTEPVADFPAVEVVIEDYDNGCFVGVDVAEGQYLWAEVALDNAGLPKAPEPCEYAHQFAESAMSTLVDS